MIIDGRAIAQGILDEVKDSAGGRDAAPRLSIITCTPDFATQKYLALKKKKAAQVGVSVNIIELSTTCTTDEAKQTVATAADNCDGVVVQLPLPGHIDTDAVLAAVPTTHDVDAIHYDGENEDVLPPVVGAIAAVAAQHDVVWEGKRVTIIGAGRLVGAPALLWASARATDVTLITRETPADQSATAIADADIIISGAGSPGLITPDAVKDGAIIFDAGTSEDGGELRGDATPECADKATLFTPVPGGIGPITIAVLLQNLLTLSRPLSQ